MALNQEYDLHTLANAVFTEPPPLSDATQSHDAIFLICEKAPTISEVKLCGTDLLLYTVNWMSLRFFYPIETDTRHMFPQLIGRRWSDGLAPNIGALVLHSP